MPQYDDPLWTIIVLAILILTGVWAYSRSNQQGRTYYGTETTKPKEGGHSSPRVESAPHEENSKNRSNDRNYHDHTIRNWTAVIAASGVFATIFSAFTLSAMRGQLGVMRDQLKETRTTSDDTKRAIEATNRLANETKRQADLAQQNMTLSRRPWIDFSDGPQMDEPLHFYDNGFVTLSVKTSARNTGNSPAVNVVLISRVHLGDWPSGNIQDVIRDHICALEKNNFLGAPFSQVIMPNSVAPLWPSKDASNKIEQDTPQTIHVWTSVCLQYQDEFGIPYSTGQIFVYIPDGGVPMKTPLTGLIAGKLRAYTGKILK
jgi:hypothetical protein